MFLIDSNLNKQTASFYEALPVSQFASSLVFLLDLLDEIIYIAEILYQMKASSYKTQNLSDLKIMFRPLSIAFNRPKGHHYKLYLEKNVQIIGEIKEIITVSPRTATYVFAFDLEPITFRVAYEKMSNYQISLYELNPGGLEVLIESAEFNLQKFIKAYFKEFLKCEEQLSSEMIGKKQDSIADIWQTLSNNLAHKVYTSTIQFKKTDAIIDFICTPESQYDQIVKQSLIIEKYNNEQTRSRKGGEYPLTKSKTLPEKFQDSKNLFVSGNCSGSEIIASSAHHFQVKNRKSPSVHQLDHLHINIQSPQSMDQFPNTIRIITGNGARKTNKYDIEFQKSKGPILIYEGSDEESNSYKIRQRFASNDFHQQLEDPTGKPVPEIYISNFRDIVIPQGSPSILKKGQLSLISTMKVSRQRQKPNQSNIKQYIIKACWIATYAFMIVFLMHPIPKVG